MIQAIRWFKRNVTRNEKGYNLIVCKECYPRYYKDRKKFEHRQMLYIGLGAIFALALIISSGNKLLAIFYGISVLVFIYLLSILTYVPALEMPAKGPGQKQ